MMRSNHEMGNLEPREGRTVFLNDEINETSDIYEPMELESVSRNSLRNDRIFTLDSAKESLRESNTYVPLFKESGNLRIKKDEKKSVIDIFTQKARFQRDMSAKSLNNY